MGIFLRLRAFYGGRHGQLSRPSLAPRSRQGDCRRGDGPCGHRRIDPDQSRHRVGNPRERPHGFDRHQAAPAASTAASSARRPSSGRGRRRRKEGRADPHRCAQAADCRAFNTPGCSRALAGARNLAQRRRLDSRQRHGRGRIRQRPRRWGIGRHLGIFTGPADPQRQSRRLSRARRRTSSKRPGNGCASCSDRRSAHRLPRGAVEWRRSRRLGSLPTVDETPAVSSGRG